MCSWFAMNAPELIPDTETCAGSAGKRPSGSAADAQPPNHTAAAVSNAAPARSICDVADIGRLFRTKRLAEPSPPSGAHRQT
jgi:hypothetical protein